MAAQAMPYPGMYYGMQGMQPAFMDPHAAERQMQEYARLQQEQAKRRPELYGELDMSPIDRIPYIYIYINADLSLPYPYLYLYLHLLHTDIDMHIDIQNITSHHITLHDIT